MPLCIKDPKKSYKGNEPSPKGLGYCAHSEEIGTIKKGLDGIFLRKLQKITVNLR